MSIASEISRISGNVTDSLSAVAAKGVTVPSGSTSDDLPGLIAQISTSGDGNAITITDTIDAAGGTVRTITAVDISDTTAVAEDVASGKYFYTANGTKTAGTGSGSGSDFIVTLSYNSTSEMWEPDKTYSEVRAAQNAGKNIAFRTDQLSDDVSADGEYNSGNGKFTYWVREFIFENTESIKEYSYSFGGSELILNDSFTYIIPSGTKSITANGTEIDVKEYAYVDVAVSSSPNLQAKTNINPTESSQTIQADNGYDGLSSVQINAISSTYVGSGITSRSSSDLTANGATVSVPAGYYASAAKKAVSAMTLPTAAAASATSGYTSKATISRSTSDQYINIPTGYNSTSAYYKINAVANGSVTAPASISGTSATLSTGTGTLTLTKTVSVTPNVTSAGYISSGTAGDSSVSLTAAVTIDPTPTASGATVTIPAGYYSSQATKTISSGTEGTPIATKGTVSNHSISVTPSVTNTSGYITGSTISGTAITVSASELVSGTKSISANGTGIDVTNYASVDVDVESAESDYTLVNIIPSQTVNCNTAVGSYAKRSAYFTNIPLLEDSKQYLVTFDNVEYVCECGVPETGWICIGDPRIETSYSYMIVPFCICHETNGNTYFIEVKNADSGNHTLKVDEIHFLGTGTTLQSKTITANGTYNASSDSVDGYSSVTVNIPGGSSKAIYKYSGLVSRTANSYGATDAKVTVTKAGTYNISFVAIRGSSSGTMGTNLYIGSTGKGNNTTWNNGTYGQSVSYTSQSISANTDVTIYATSGNNSRTIYVGQLIVEEV